MALKALRIRVRADLPLLLGGPTGLSNYQETDTFIPGAVLRGAVAERFLSCCLDGRFITNHAACPQEIRRRCPFYQVFGAANAPLFGNCTPSQGAPSFPFPATACTCKVHPGFLDSRETHLPSDQRERHGIFDSLIRQFTFETMLKREREERIRLAALYFPRCSLCGGSVQPPLGVYQLDLGTEGARAYLSPEVNVDRASHTAINRARGVAEDAMLYTLETITAGAVFEGQVIIDEGYETAIREALRGEFDIGRGVSRGMGRVTVDILEHRPLMEDLSTRLNAFNSLLKEERRFYAQMDPRVTPEFEGLYFSLDLLSDAILNRDGVPLAQPAAKDLGLPTSVERVCAWARTTVVGGWHGAAGMPRRTELAVQRGAVYLFYAPPSVDRKSLEEVLEKLELTGIGEERERGYGRVTVCATFHQEVEPR